VADHRAIYAVSEAVMGLLRQAYDPALFASGAPLEFKVVNADGFKKPIKAGVTLFLYRVLPGGVQRTPPAPVRLDGTRRKRPLPLELHLLLTVWADDASLEQTLLGWMLRTLEDTPVLGAPLLNGAVADVFDPDETVEITLGPLTNEDLFHIWELLPKETISYRLSVPYVARFVRLDSLVDDTQGGPVRRREFDFALVQE
jgi:hypothetical protein